MQAKNKRQWQRELKNWAELVRCAEEFHLVGDPTRLKICYLLCRHKELSVGEIADMVGVSISAVSHTLRKLKEAHMVEDRRSFRHVYYHLNPSSLRTYINGRLHSI